MNTKFENLREEEKDWRERMKELYAALIHTQRVNILQ
jgi:hypothetical protein